MKYWVDIGLPVNMRKIAVSAYRRVPVWIRIDIERNGLLSECILEGLISALEVYRTLDPDDQSVPKEVYNASQRGMYRFIKSLGYRKKKYGKKSCWCKREVVVTQDDDDTNPWWDRQ